MIERSDALERLAALAHDGRLAVFELLVRAGRDGLPAGVIGARLSIPPTALSFHLSRLRHARLVAARRDGRRIFYAAEFAAARALAGFLFENCCAEDARGCSADCPPAAAEGAAAGEKRRIA